MRATSGIVSRNCSNRAARSARFPRDTAASTAWSASATQAAANGAAGIALRSFASRSRAFDFQALDQPQHRLHRQQPAVVTRLPPTRPSRHRARSGFRRAARRCWRAAAPSGTTRGVRFPGTPCAGPGACGATSGPRGSAAAPRRCAPPGMRPHPPAPAACRRRRRRSLCDRVPQIVHPAGQQIAAQKLDLQARRNPAVPAASGQSAIVASISGPARPVTMKDIEFGFKQRGLDGVMPAGDPVRLQRHVVEHGGQEHDRALRAEALVAEVAVRR